MRTSRLPLLLIVALLVACSGVKQDWRSAQAADTLEAYDAFLAKHGDSEFATLAKERVTQLTEERDWEIATQSDTTESYQKFLTQHPEGKWSQEARVRIENFNVMNAAAAPPRRRPRLLAKPATAATAPSPRHAAAAAPKAPAPKAPAPAAPVERTVPPAAARNRPAPQKAPAAAAAAGAAAPASSSARSTEAKARAEWRRLQSKFAALKGHEPQIAAAQTPAGKLYRLQMRVADEAAGAKLCATLKAGGQGCIVVPAGR
ncbi:MAG: hypothetical protein U1F11_06600 [Steroidobacteraceae bacterium]